MKHLKYFEKIERKPKVGDYVIIDSAYTIEDKELEYFIENTIGKIHRIDFRYTYVDVQYSNIPFDLMRYFNSNIIDFNSNCIKYFSKDREVVEMMLNTNKYNL